MGGPRPLFFLCSENQVVTPDFRICLTQDRISVKFRELNIIHNGEDMCKPVVRQILRQQNAFVFSVWEMASSKLKCLNL